MLFATQVHMPLGRLSPGGEGGALISVSERPSNGPDRPPWPKSSVGCANGCSADATATWDFIPCSSRHLGRFALIREMGSGTFSTVFEAQDTALNRTVALKVPHPGTDPDVNRARLYHEVGAATRLHHPSIATVFEVCEIDGRPIAVGELIRGITLAQLLAGARPNFHDTAAMIATVADALQHAHDQSIVHCDVKSANILIDGFGQPFLIDFGLAKRDGKIPAFVSEGRPYGSPAYMSPEQARGDTAAVGELSDIYSLGVTLYEMLTGVLPYQGNALAVLHQILHNDPPHPSRLASEIPDALEVVCLKAMSKSPGERFATAREMASALRCYVSAPPSSARTE